MTRRIELERVVAVDQPAAARVLAADPLAIVTGGSPELPLRATLAGFEVTRPVVVDVTAVHDLDRNALAVDLAWHAADHGRGFPTLTGFLELSALSHHPPLSRLALVATVVPPLGSVGALGDALGLASVQDEVLAQLLDDVTARLVAAVAADAEAVSRRAVTSSLVHPRFVLPD